MLTIFQSRRLICHFLVSDPKFASHTHVKFNFSLKLCFHNQIVAHEAYFSSPNSTFTGFTNRPKVKQFPLLNKPHPTNADRGLYGLYPLPPKLVSFSQPFRRIGFHYP